MLILVKHCYCGLHIYRIPGSIFMSMIINLLYADIVNSKPSWLYVNASCLEWLLSCLLSLTLYYRPHYLLTTFTCIVQESLAAINSAISSKWITLEERKFLISSLGNIGVTLYNTGHDQEVPFQVYFISIIMAKIPFLSYH